jgi:hypothetical protein
VNALRTVYRVEGTLAGPIWWPYGAPASKTFEYRTSERPASLRDLAESILNREDGDFSGAPRFLADTTLTITRYGSTGHHGRTFDLGAFASLAAYTSADWPDWDGEA